MSSYNTAYYMEKLDTFEKYKDVINENKLFSCLDSVESYILTEHIDSSKPARNYNSLFSLTINKENELEKILYDYPYLYLNSFL